jgi:PAS domain S-box-containing protein
MLGYGTEADVLRLNLGADIYRHANDRARLIEEYRNRGRFAGFETEWKRMDGATILVRLSGRPVRDAQGEVAYFEMTAEDITERRRLETTLRQAQKMEAVGRLAGGIAHDFNNLLMLIKGYSDLLRDRLPAEETPREYASEIQKAADRASSLTQQLLAFSRKQVLELRVLDVNQVVTSMSKMLPRLLGEDIEVVTRLNSAIGRVKADPGQLEQVLMNLAVNARDAMPEGGRLTIETGECELDDEYVRQHPGARPGRFVMLAVSDTGVGMNTDVRAHVFEPFFTTKAKGKGTGLGLAMVYGIVKQSNGYIWVYSEPGQGATFKVYLPRVEEAAESELRAPATGPPPRGTETVLVVEDEDGVRRVTREYLEANGYSVLEAQSGAEALAVAEQHAGPLHLVLTDVVMPGMSGRELTERLRRRRPELRVIFMSGYTDDAVMHHGALAPGVAFLQKPFARDALARKVREVLDGQAPAAAG